MSVAKSFLSFGQAFPAGVDDIPQGLPGKSEGRLEPFVRRMALEQKDVHRSGPGEILGGEGGVSNSLDLVDRPPIFRRELDVPRILLESGLKNVEGSDEVSGFHSLRGRFVDRHDPAFFQGRLELDFLERERCREGPEIAVAVEKNPIDAARRGEILGGEGGVSNSLDLVDRPLIFRRELDVPRILLESGLKNVQGSGEVPDRHGLRGRVVDRPDPAFFQGRLQMGLFKREPCRERPEIVVAVEKDPIDAARTDVLLLAQGPVGRALDLFDRPDIVRRELPAARGLLVLGLEIVEGFREIALRQYRPGFDGGLFRHDLVGQGAGR
ncbi:MAG: hypothetical protein NT147_04435 [Candidatus Aminicenantes bacterium]|nr:hypothetical protein [Candidatus Aminicenantes bacterium]